MATGQALPGRRPAARLLDLSRLFSRVGRGFHTGVDRVEAAYLARLLDDPLPLFSLVHTPEGFHLLDRAGTQGLADRFALAEPWGRADFRALLRRRASPAQRAARADLRRLAVGQARLSQLPALLRRHLPADTSWINVGHSNLEPGVFEAVRSLPGGASAILIHDTIPLDFPQFQRPGTVAKFSDKIKAVAEYADLVICTSKATQADAIRHFSSLGSAPDMLVAHLGVAPSPPNPADLPDEIDPSQSWFLTLGTIEPRKNHALLLDIWEDFAKTLPANDIPRLVIAGRRGWRNEALFERLDTSPLMGTCILEFGELDDAAVSALIAGARALLMPSLAEGFGLPPAEALALGTPVIANDLPVYREVLGNNPVYVPVGERYSWAQQVIDIARTRRTTHKAADRAAMSLPTWQEHFNLVLKVT